MRATRVEMEVAGSAQTAVGHEYLHLSDGEVLDVFIRHARLFGLADVAPSGALVFFAE